MSRLPQGELILELRKLEDYCLNPTHPRGRHKARVFRDALGLAREDAEWLRAALLAAAPQCDAVELADDGLGRRWRADIELTRHDRRAVVRTVWMLPNGKTALRFITCWVL